MGICSIGVACMATGIGYAAVELIPAAADAYRYGLGALQWPASAILALLGSDPVPPLIPVLAISDPWDLLALSALIVPWRLGRARSTRTSAHGVQLIGPSRRRAAE